MKVRKFIKEIYESDALYNADLLEQYIHPEITLEWYSSKGFLVMKKKDILLLAKELERTYKSMRSEISHIIKDDNKVTVRYKHFGKTIENPAEEILLASFIVIWEIKDDKLYQGYQMSQLY
ncbi:nuclear transport factor 2 family protein [Flavobacterium sp. H122]|uniref:nuclear transport factor 2 family protein n=1 Tax=Flavobacterium sp. H122 TaxID=2529860 RepID=UPI0010AB4E27|nr:nuclear transport factor 2 family protein [Flavobacterium sp. H122]